MRNIKWLLAAGLIAATTAACTEQYGYPSTAYNGYPSAAYTGGNYNNGYYRNGGAYNSAAYVAPVAPGYVAPTPPRRGPNGDYDRDGVPNKYDRDANGDGVPDRYQH